MRFNTAKPIAPEPKKTLAQLFEEDARKLVERARHCGLVITVSQIPKTPLAMGNHETVVGVRAALNRRG